MALTYTGVTYDSNQHCCNYGVNNVTPRGTHILDRRDLYFKDGSSDKVYVIITSQSPGGTDYFVDAFFGRRSATCQHQPKAQVRDVQTAQRMASKLILEKKNKGYVDYVPGTPNTAAGQPVVNANARKGGQFPPSDLVFPVPVALMTTKLTATSVIDDTTWILEEMFEGMRCFVHVPDDATKGVQILTDSTVGYSDAAIVLPHIVSFMKSFGYSKNFTIDGYLMHKDPSKCTVAEVWNTMHQTPADREQLYIRAVDLPYYGDAYLTSMEWKDRRRTLTELFNGIKGSLTDKSWNYYDDFQTNPVVLSRYAFTKKEEFAMGKGAVVGKNLRGKYMADNPAKVLETKDKWVAWKVGTKRG